MNQIDRREARFQKINRAFFALYLLLMIALTVLYAVRGDGYHLGTCLGALAVPAAMAVFYRLTRLKVVHQIDFIILLFTLLAYPLGSCLDFYARFPGYDKLVHMLSGAFVSLLCILLYCMLKPGHRVEGRDLALAALFTFFGSMAVAGLWELGEYALSFITGRDLQKVIGTGVGDTMQDMLVCMIGTLATLPVLRPLSRGTHNAFTGPIDAFIAKNLPEA